MKTSLLCTLASSLVLGFSIPLAVADDEDEKKEEKAVPKDFRTFTAKNGKSLKARVLTRIDDERYTVETPEGKKFTLNVNTLSKSDQQFLEFWEPNAIIDLKTAELPDVLDQMGYSVLDLSSNGDYMFVTATVDGKEGKFVLDASRKFSTIDPKAAEEAGISLSQGNINFTAAGGQVTRSKRGTAKVFKAGLVEVKSHAFESITINMMFRSVPANTIGAIGGDLLKKLNALVDYEGKRLFVKGDG